MIDSKEMTATRLAEVLGKYESNPSRILSELKAGKLGVTIEWITACQDKLGLNPGILFGNQSTGAASHTTGQFTSTHTAADYAHTEDAADHIEDEPNAYSNAHNAAVQQDAFVTHSSSEAARSVHTLLQRHRIKIDQYTRQQLGISRQQYYQYVNGNSRLPFDVVQKVCEDTGESLDQFRSKPLPEGHLLDRIKYLTELVKAKDELIEMLKNNR